MVSAVMPRERPSVLRRCIGPNLPSLVDHYSLANRCKMMRTPKSDISFTPGPLNNGTFKVFLLSVSSLLRRTYFSEPCMSVDPFSRCPAYPPLTKNIKGWCPSGPKLRNSTCPQNLALNEKTLLSSTNWAIHRQLSPVRFFHRYPSC